MDTAGLRQSDLETALATVGVRRGDVVLAHSSLSAFGWVQGGADTVIDALLATIGPTGTLVLPTFTWDANHAAERCVFDVAATAGETGTIPETFRRRPGVMRSAHICHSYAALGPQAEAVIGDGVHPFVYGGAFDGLRRLNAWNLLLGVGFSSCTALHAAEELAQVPYRHYRSYPQATVVGADGTRQACQSLEYLRQQGVFNDFAKTDALFEQAGILRTAQAGRARVINARVRDVIDTACTWLARDPWFLTTAAR